MHYILHPLLYVGERPFKCTTDGCKEAFISKGRYEVHVEVKHPGEAPLKCESCPRSFFRHHRLRDHKKSHSGEKSYLCEICSKAFSQPAYLKYHQTKHKELNLAEFKCDYCDKKFASPINLRLHKETQHLKKYRFHCEVCGHGATHMSHMKLHMRRHTGKISDKRILSYMLQIIAVQTEWFQILNCDFLQEKNPTYAHCVKKALLDPVNLKYISEAIQVKNRIAAPFVINALRIIQNFGDTNWHILGIR